MANLVGVLTDELFRDLTIMAGGYLSLGSAAAGALEGGALIGVKHLHDREGVSEQKATLIKVGRYALLAVAAIAAVTATAGACLAAGAVVCVLAMNANLAFVTFEMLLIPTYLVTAAATTYGHYKAFNWALN